MENRSIKSLDVLKTSVVFLSGLVQLYTYYMLSSTIIFSIIAFIYRKVMDVDAYVQKNGIDPSATVTMMVGFTLVPLLTMGLAYWTFTFLRRQSWKVVALVVSLHIVMASMFIF
ncbi:hypothetical protein [Metabacillus iocasae]|uniref:Uncharacterized protein n=1 Tax=Priestia iocasae TaxID=2291674 RepID=A0ABS2QU41_9BACI|nr:hypothetical protein [Metabacillus iocasae]MBM7702935.1 hypothetical protein [Metabacillus iocasae]